MKLVFLQDDLNEHFGPMYISAVLKKHGHFCELLVEGLEPDLIKSVQEAKPDMVAFSVMTGTHKWLANTIKELKRTIDVPVIVGGPHPTYFPEAIEVEGVDIICMGEGEHAVVELANRFDREEDYSNIPNLYVKKNGRIIRNTVGPLYENLDELPFADRELYDKYPFFKGLQEVRISCSRGCPWKCTFCYNASRKALQYGSNFVRLRSVKSIIDELEGIRSKRKNMRSVTIVDDILGINRKWLGEFCDEYKKRINLPWLASIRADLATEFAVKKMQEANCFCLSVGVESGNAFLREIVLGKTISEEALLKAAHLIKEAGIKLRTSNMLFLPGEDLDKAFETIYINKKMGADYPWAYTFQPYPKTPIYEYAVKNNCLKKEFSIDDIDPLGLLKSPIQLEDGNKILVLQRLFYYGVNVPGFTYLLKFLVYVPNNFFFDLLHKLAILYTYASYHQLGIFKSLKIAFQARRQLVESEKKKQVPKIEDVKKTFTLETGLFWRISFHAGLYVLAVIGAFGAYREYFKGYEHILSHFTSDYLSAPGLSRSVKESIVATFPWATIIFALVYSTQALYQRGKDLFLPYSRYLAILICTGFLINLSFVSNTAALAVLNLSIVLLGFLLVALREGQRLLMHAIFFFLEKVKIIRNSFIYEWIRCRLAGGITYMEPLMAFQGRVESNRWLVSFMGTPVLVLAFYIAITILAYLPTMEDVLRSDHWLFLVLARSKEATLWEVLSFEMFGHPCFDQIRWYIFYILDILLGNNMFLYHLVTILAHSINCFLIFLIARTVFGTNLFPFLMGLLFAVLTSHADTVAWPLLLDFHVGVMFAFLALLCLARFMWLNRSISNVYFGLFLAASSLFLRECFIIISFMVCSIFILWFYYSEGNKERQYGAKHLFLVLFGTTAAYSIYFYASLVLNPNVAVSKMGVFDFINWDTICMEIYLTFAAIISQCFLNNLGVFPPKIDISCLVYLYPSELWTVGFQILALVLFSWAFFSLARWGTWYFTLPILFAGVCEYLLICMGRYTTGGIDYIISRSHYAYFPNAVFLLAIGLLVWPPNGRVKKFMILLLLVVILIPLNFKNTYYFNTRVNKAVDIMNTHYKRVKSFLEKNPNAMVFLDFIPSNEHCCFGLGSDVAFDVLFPNNVTRSMKKATHIYNSKSFEINPNYSTETTSTLGDFTVEWYMWAKDPTKFRKEVVVLGSDNIYPKISLTKEGLVNITMVDAKTKELSSYCVPYPVPLYMDFRGQGWTWIIIEKQANSLCFILNGKLCEKFDLNDNYLGWQEDGLALLGNYYRGAREEVHVARLFVKVGDTKYAVANRQVGYVLNIPVVIYVQ